MPLPGWSWRAFLNIFSGASAGRDEDEYANELGSLFGQVKESDPIMCMPRALNLAKCIK